MVVQVKKKVHLQRSSEFRNSFMNAKLHGGHETKVFGETRENGLKG